MLENGLEGVLEKNSIRLGSVVLGALAPFHSMTSSARASSVGGKSRPRTRDAEKRPASSRMGADIFAEIESLARTYERPALRKLFAAFPADTKVA
jgi:hypothetical protein